MLREPWPLHQQHAHGTMNATTLIHVLAPNIYPWEHLLGSSLCSPSEIYVRMYEHPTPLEIRALLQG
jgi:hypothetical protein